MTQNSIIAQSDTAVTVSNSAKDNYTIIEIAERNYAIKTKNILEIIKIVELDRPEGILSCILGIIHYKQEPVSVIDLREVFKKERIVYNLNAKIIVVQTEHSKTAIVCDNVLDIKKIEPDSIHSMQYQQDSEFFEGVCLFKEEDVYIINLDKITNYILDNPQLFSKNNTNCYVVDDEDSKQTLLSRKNALIELDNAVPPNISLYDSGVSFLIDDAKYYINMASVKEFYKVKNSKFIKVPCTKKYIFGLINIKGEYIVVVDIKSLFYNSETTIKEKSTIIILNSEEYKIGILADEICESINIDFDEIVQSKLQKNDENKMTEFVKDNEIYQVLDIDQLLKDERLNVC